MWKADSEPYLKVFEKLNMTTNKCIVVEMYPWLSLLRSEMDSIIAVATTLDFEMLKHADLLFKDHAAPF